MNNVHSVNSTNKARPASRKTSVRVTHCNGRTFYLGISEYGKGPSDQGMSGIEVVSSSDDDSYRTDGSCRTGDDVDYDDSDDDDEAMILDDGSSPQWPVTSGCNPRPPLTSRAKPRSPTVLGLPLGAPLIEGRRPLGPPHVEGVSLRSPPVKCLLTRPPSLSLGLEVDGGAIKDAVECAMALFDVAVDEAKVKSILTEAYKVTSQTYGTAAAVQWASEKGWKGIPREVIDSDYGLLRAAGRNPIAMFQRRLAQLRPHRLNVERVKACISNNNPRYDDLLKLGEGIASSAQWLPPNFEPNGRGVRPPLRSKYKTAYPAVNKACFDIHQQGLAFVFEPEVAVEFPRLQINPSNHALKKNKPSGRPTMDCNSRLPNSSLNGPEVKEAIVWLYSALRHPIIAMFCLMILRVYDEEQARNPDVKWSDLVLWKKDLKGAYNLISFRAEDVPLFATELIDDKNPELTLIMIFLCGMFGWTGTPGAFNVVSEGISWELNNGKLRGECLVYVDDMIGATFTWNLEHDTNAADTLCTTLLGPNAIATEKNESGRRIDAIGWTLDLGQSRDLARLTIAEKNFQNAIHGFFHTDIHQPVRVKDLERLASWGSRYLVVCPYLKPFHRDIYFAYKGLGRHVSVLLPARARRAICLWRVILVLLHFDQDRFARPMRSFVFVIARAVIETDSCLSGAGCLIYLRDRGGNETVVGGSAGSLAMLGFGSDSSYQNCCEFIGIILGILTLRLLGYDDLEFELRTDSMSALRWAEKEKYRGDIITNSSILLTSLVITKSLTVTAATHLEAKLNDKCDDLSRIGERGVSAESVLESHNLSHIPFINLDDQPATAEILQLCNPANIIDNDDSANSEQRFNAFWRSVQRCISKHF